MIERHPLLAAVSAAVLVALGFLCTGSVRAETVAVPQSAEQVRLSYAPLVEQVAPAVVNIYTRKIVETRSPLFNDPFFQKFFGQQFGGTRKKAETALGSGVIVEGDGIVVTNHHVIADATDIRVILRDKRQYNAQVVLSDERTDLAILKLEDVKQTLPTVTLGDSDVVHVGDLVLAIGNPFGVGQTVTSGIVSGLARTQVDVADYQSFIQTDAAINPGNSGGALVAMDGSIIGINTAIFSKSGGSHGIGFAVPVNMVQAVLKSALSGQPLVRPWLGFDGKDVDWDMAMALGMNAPHGVIVEQIRDGGPADDAGLESGDIITAIDGIIVDDAQNLRFRAATKGVGEHIRLGILRDGREIEKELILIAPPEDPPQDPIAINRDAPIAGARFVNLSPALCMQLGIQPERSGVMVIELLRNSPAARLGLQVGDILVSISGREIDLTEDLRSVLDNPPSSWSLVIDRNGEKLSVQLR